MREWLSFPPDPVAWPDAPGRGRALADDRAGDLTAAVTDVISATGDTRRLTCLSAGLLAAVLVGAATVTAALLGRGHPVSLGSVGLLLPVILSWLVTVVLVLIAERPVTGAFAELRRSTGAPVDPSAPWAPLGVRPLADSAVTFGHVVPLIAAATRQHTRARLALSAAVITTAVFLLWMVLSLTAATLT
jgi:hypothetical protein